MWIYLTAGDCHDIIRNYMGIYKVLLLLNKRGNPRFYFLPSFTKAIEVSGTKRSTTEARCEIKKCEMRDKKMRDAR